MCAHHDHLDDDITDLFGAPATPVSDDAAKLAFDSLRNASHDPAPGADLFYEPCQKCRGSGRFVGYTGRVLGECFTCKGTGQIGRKTSKETRDAQAARKAARLKETLEAWTAQHSAEWLWICGNSRLSFVTEMVAVLAKKGELSEGQLGAIRRMMQRDKERAAQRAEAEATAAQIETAGLDRIMAAFNRARENAVKRPKMRLGEFYFSLVVDGKNAGSIYVKSLVREDENRGGRLYLGRITDGKFVKGYACKPEEAAEIVKLASDPEAGVKAYGQRTGQCSICGIELTNAVSIERSVGPICWSKFFG